MFNGNIAQKMHISNAFVNFSVILYDFECLIISACSVSLWGEFVRGRNNQIAVLQLHLQDLGTVGTSIHYLYRKPKYYLFFLFFLYKKIRFPISNKVSSSHTPHLTIKELWGMGMCSKRSLCRVESDKKFIPFQPEIVY